MEVTREGNCHTSGYKTQIPNIPKGTGTYKVVKDGRKGSSVYGNGQGTTAAMVMGNREE